MRIKVFDIVNPENANEIINDWIDELEERDDEVEVLSVAQSESAAANDFFHLTITVVWQFRRSNTASTGQWDSPIAGNYPG